jgi:hypothetical protein
MEKQNVLRMGIIIIQMIYLPVAAAVMKVEMTTMSNITAFSF